MTKPTKIKRIEFNEHDETWNMFDEIEKLKNEVENTKNIEGKFIDSRKRNLKIKEEKLNRYLTHPTSARSLRWKGQIINEYADYQKKGNIKKKSLTRLSIDLMAQVSNKSNSQFPVDQQEVIRYLVTMGFNKRMKY